MTETTHTTDTNGTGGSRVSETRARGVAKMNEVYGWELPADVPGDFFAVTADHLFASADRHVCSEGGPLKWDALPQQMKQTQDLPCSNCARRLDWDDVFAKVCRVLRHLIQVEGIYREATFGLRFGGRPNPPFSELRHHVPVAPDGRRRVRVS